MTDEQHGNDGRTRKVVLLVWLVAIVAFLLPMVLYFLESSPASSLSTGEVLQRHSSLFEQWIAVLSGFVIKPAYMLLSLILIIWIWRVRKPEIVALRWAMVAFLTGELWCAINYVVFGHQSHVSEYFHSAGMVAAFSLSAYAVLIGVDLHLLHFGDATRRCALDLCTACYKHDDVACGMRRLFLLIVPATMVVALMLFTLPIRNISYNTVIFDTPYHYSHPWLYQMFEIRICPAYALISLLAAFLMLLFGGRKTIWTSKVLFAAGLGPLGFGILRGLLLQSFTDALVWLNFWEEISELVFVIGVGYVLWIFRTSLLKVTHSLPSS